jgi:hypothetical protein
MNGFLILCAMSLHSAVMTNDWTPLVAAEGALVTIEMDVSSVPLPSPLPKLDGAGKGVKLESPLSTYRDAQSLIQKGNELADRGKAILNRAEREGKLTVDIRLPALPADDSSSRRKTCSSGNCPLSVKVPEDTSTNDKPAQTHRSGPFRHRHCGRERR